MTARTVTQRGRGAFTLLEMMVALAITSLLSVMMLQMFSDSSSIWQREDQRLETFREARAALQLMTRELSTVLPMPAPTTPAPATPALPPPARAQFPVLALRGRTRHPAGVSPAEHFTAAYSLAATPNTGGSDLCATGYFLEWDKGGKDPVTGEGAASQPPAYRLKRQLAASDNTFTRLKTALNATAPKLGELAFGTLYDPARPPALAPDATQALASYIWDLQFAVPDPPVVKPAPSDSSSYFGTDLPQWIEVRFRALGATAARKLPGQSITEDIWNNPRDATYQRLIRPGEQQFVSRIKLAR